MTRARLITASVRGEVLAVGRAARRAATGPGRERDLLVQSLKAALAALLAWGVADGLGLPMPVIAPWVAVVLSQSTVYRSLTHGWQQLFAITLGTVLATLVGEAVPSQLLAMAIVLPVLLVLGNWPRLGSQGVYGATAALFTLSYGEPSAYAAGARVLEALLGAAIAVAVNLFVFPPMYLRSAQSAVQGVVREVREVLETVADGLAEEAWTHREARHWDERARRVPGLITDVRSTLAWDRESRWFNPRRRARRGRPEGPRQHTVWVLERVSDHLGDLTRTLTEAADEERISGRPDSEATTLYATFLHRVADACAAHGRLVSGDDPEADRTELREAVEEARRVHDALRDLAEREGARGAETMVLFGALVLDARRILEALLLDPPENSGSVPGTTGSGRGSGPGRRADA
ncbi:FUSC family protein [Streptomyces chumphonensis]|uniref:FUSC family protein n=1 Tax=Streptomyces chumphonensis TaxID=1214925 RepID=A0A927ICD2_9ACTN|nr:aromatic acid exporter family protein [Streptomyces chumphonensis]MBD3931770.1 FUSC family protein [Streptomyces chumphonensis]